MTVTLTNWDFCQLFERLAARELTILTDRKNIDHFLTFHQRVRNTHIQCIKEHYFQIRRKIYSKIDSCDFSGIIFRLILLRSFSAQFDKLSTKTKSQKSAIAKTSGLEFWKLIVGENSQNDNVTQQKRRMRRSIQTISGFRHFHFCAHDDGT